MNLLHGIILIVAIVSVIALIAWFWPTGQQGKTKFYTIDAKGKGKIRALTPDEMSRIKSYTVDSKGQIKVHAPGEMTDEEFDIKLKLFPEDEDGVNEIHTHPRLEFALKCPKCGKSLVLDQTVEDGVFQNPDGSWWVCPHCEEKVH